MSGNHPEEFPQPKGPKKISPEESEAVFDRVDKWLKAGIIGEAEVPEFPLTDVHGRQYRAEEVREFVEQFPR